MSMPNIPHIHIDEDKAIDVLIASIACEELGLAHIINAEAEKVQFVLGTLKKADGNCWRDDEITFPDLDDIVEVNKTVERVLRKVVDEEILLQFKLEDAVELKEKKRRRGRNND